MMRGEDHREDAGLITPAILLVVLALVVIGLGIVQVGLSADRSSRVQVAADAAALAGAQAISPKGPGTPSRAAPGGAQDARGAAVSYALRNLPGLTADGVRVTVDGERVTVDLRDRAPVSASPITGLRTPDNRASATAIVAEKCDDDRTTPANPDAACTSPRSVVRLVE